MNSHPSETVNGGKTVVLLGATEAIELGSQWLSKTLDWMGKMDPKKSFNASVIQRNAVCNHCGKPRADHKPKAGQYFCDDGNEYEAPEARKDEITWGSMTQQYKRMQDRFNICTTAITKGDPSTKQAIIEMAESLEGLVRDIEPSLAAGWSGFTRTSEDGVTAAPELVAQGEENCVFKRKMGSGEVKNGTGDGAYRIVLNTDVDWWGKPNDNAAMIAALVACLQQFRPVEIWIQQGWLGEYADDGITLFKLDFTNGAFDPTQLSFWMGHRDKDSVFSYAINRKLGRTSENTATTAEIPCDLCLRGDFMKMIGIEEYKFMTMLHTEKFDLLAKWIAQTAVRLVFNNEEPNLQIEG